MTPTRTFAAFAPCPGRIAGEFVLVPRGPYVAEDDGWLIGLVIDANETSTALEILDAQAIEQPSAASIHLPRRVPPGIHGTWLPKHSAAD